MTRLKLPALFRSFSKPHFLLASVLLVGLGPFAASIAKAQIEFEREPIAYSQQTPDDPIAKLQARLDRGEVKFQFDEQYGYLKSVLKALDISETSQMLVFSKTSLQLRRISPRTPRALYFNDDVYIGWIPNSDRIEVSSADPKLGGVFYTLRQDKDMPPKFRRDGGNCLSCHATSRTQRVPGHLVRSVYPSKSGQPYFGAGTYNTTQTSPLEKRWGGWYVTGRHGKQRHMGNAIAEDRLDPERLDIEAGANLSDLSRLTPIDRYVSKHSDIVAHMVLAHQAEMHNRITLASYETRMALHHGEVINKALERPADYQSDSTKRRINTVKEKLVSYMLFAGEHPLTDRIEGDSGYAAYFESLGPKDKKGRSLREFDLEKRVFKYPCSFLIYSPAFLALPKQVAEPVYRRLWEVLSSDDAVEGYEHLTKQDQQAILEILRDTHPELPAYWRGQ